MKHLNNTNIPPIDRLYYILFFSSSSDEKEELLAWLTSSSRNHLINLTHSQDLMILLLFQAINNVNKPPQLFNIIEEIALTHNNALSSCVLRSLMASMNYLLKLLNQRQLDQASLPFYSPYNLLLSYEIIHCIENVLPSAVAGSTGWAAPSQWFNLYKGKQLISHQYSNTEINKLLIEIINDCLHHKEVVEQFPLLAHALINLIDCANASSNSPN
jgi:hypothetical protein